MFKYKFIIYSVFRLHFANIEVVFRLCTKSHKLFYKKMPYNILHARALSFIHQIT